MRIDDNEYVCEECGSIYDIRYLIFLNVAYNFNKKQDEYDKLLEGVIEQHSSSDNDNLKNVIEYMCPVCKYKFFEHDRRKQVRN